VPILGYLDDLLIVQLGIVLALRLVPAPLMTECPAAAAARLDRPASRGGLAFIVALWLAVALAMFWSLVANIALFAPRPAP
jgi:hypothetical protein